MDEKFKNKYRIKSNRLPHWNYGSVGAYFVTICTQHRLCYFGNISDDRIHLSDMGKIVEKEWIKTLELRPDMNLQLGEYVVMPNHFHAIIFIGENPYNTPKNPIPLRRDALHASPRWNNQFGGQSKNLAAVIRGFKASVTKQAREIHADFAWQARYHEHIIRNEKSYQEISEYIKNNPLTWADDLLYQI